MDTTIQICKRGTMKLPAKLRAKYEIRKGDKLHLIDLDGVFVLTPMVPMVPELAREIERIRLEAGISMDELIQGLREQRAKYHQSKD